MIKLNKLVLAIGLFAGFNTRAEVTATMFGTVNVGIKSADRIVLSYGKDVLTAPTESGPMTNSAIPNYDHLSHMNRTSIQSAQSKFGWNFRTNEYTSGVLELDMVDFKQGTPSTHILRVRKASFQHKFSEDSKIRIGKDFSIFNGVGPHTSNWVGGSYRAGNTGFVLDEMVYFKSIASFEVACSVGNFGRNFGETYSATELPSDLSFPSATLRIEHQFNSGRWGIAYIGSEGAKWQLRDPSATNTKANAAKLYADLNFWNSNWRFSAYKGTNTSDLALLGLASSKQSSGYFNLDEQGAFLSVQHNVTDTSKIYWGLSHAQILNPEMGLSQNVLTRNQVTRIGFKREMERGLETFLELTEFRSGYSVAVGSSDVVTATSTLGHFGFLYHF
jgi:hypothetical protein